MVRASVLHTEGWGFDSLTGYQILGEIMTGLYSELLGTTIPTNWQLVAVVDDSQEYEVDITELYKNGDQWVLLTASGCSCWSGEYETRTFGSLDELVTAIKSKDSDAYLFNPSADGLTRLIAQANNV